MLYETQTRQFECILDAIRTENDGLLADMLASDPVPQAWLNYCLRQAVKAENAGAVQALLAVGADPADSEFEAVRVASANPGHPDILRALLAAGPAPQHLLMRELLFHAAEYNQVGILKCLIDFGVDPRQKTDYALRAGAKHGGELVRLLLSAGANPDAGPGEPLRVAILGKNLSAIEQLLQAGAKLDGTVLDLALPHSTPEIIRALRAAGAEAPRPLSIICRGSVENQRAFFSVGDVVNLDPVELARLGTAPSALALLLERQGHAELSAMLQATQMLEPMTPSERAELLADMLTRNQPEPIHAGP